PPGALTLIGSFPTLSAFPHLLGPRPESVVVDPAGSFLYVAGRARADAAYAIVQAYRIESSGTLTPIDEQIVPRSGYPDILTNALAVDPHSRFLFMAGTIDSVAPATSSLAVFKILTNGALRPIPTPPFPFPLSIREGGILKGITVHPTGQWLYTV